MDDVGECLLDIDILKQAHGHKDTLNPSYRQVGAGRADTDPVQAVDGVRPARLGHRPHPRRLPPRLAQQQCRASSRGGLGCTALSALSTQVSRLVRSSSTKVCHIPQAVDYFLSEEMLVSWAGLVWPHQSALHTEYCFKEGME